nr:hypothetical protein [uncultured archaeon]
MTKRDIERWISGLDVKNSTRNAYLVVVKLFYSWLHDNMKDPTTDDLQRFGKIQDIESFEEGSNSEGEILSPEDILNMVRESPNRTYKKFIVLFSYLGFRRDELRLLTKDMVDFDSNIISVPREITKTPAGVRDVPFHPFIGELLKESRGKYVVGGKKPYSQSFFTWGEYDKVVGQHVHTHLFRKTFNTLQRRILQEELGPAMGDVVLKDIMGHEYSESMTDLYTGKTKSFEDDKKWIMNSGHYYNRDDLFERLGEHL